MRFNQLAKDSMKRVRYVKTCPDCKRELGPDDIVKGYQYEKGKYVVVTDEELESIKSEADRSMKIVQFADADEISPIFFEKPYQIVAQPGGERALELLRQAMLAENKVAIGTTVLGNSETPVAIMPYGDDLVMITLHYASEVKDIPKTVQHPDVAEPELDMAKRLIDSMTEPFDPARFKNAYQEKLMDLIQSKIAGQGRGDRTSGRAAEQHHRPHGRPVCQPEGAGGREGRRRQARARPQTRGQRWPRRRGSETFREAKRHDPQEGGFIRGRQRAARGPSGKPSARQAFRLPSRSPMPLTAQTDARPKATPMAAPARMSVG